MYHFNYFSSSFPGNVSEGELINGSNKEPASIVPSTRDSLSLARPFSSTDSRRDSSVDLFSGTARQGLPEPFLCASVWPRHGELLPYPPGLTRA